MSTDCLACDLTSGALPLPGGAIYETELWRAEHCVGPFGVGALIVKPKRHTTFVADLTPAEAAELGPLLRLASKVITAIVNPQQVYVSLWSHEGGEPGHIHFVLQPVTSTLTEQYGLRGSRLITAMANAGERPEARAVEEFARLARDRFALTED